MTNSTLFIKSLAVIALLAGFAHIFSCVNKKNKPKPEQQLIVNDMDSNAIGSLKDTVTIDTIDTNSPKGTKQTITKDVKPKQQNSIKYNPETDYIIGKWSVEYNTKEFKGSIIYELKKEGTNFNAYTFQYEDENGYSQKAEGTKTLTIKNFDGYKGKGIYMTEYENEKYDIPCQIDMVDENTFKLSYDYYGYSDVETWKRF